MIGREKPEPRMVWAHQIAARKAARACLRVRLAAGAIGVSIILASAVIPPRTRLVWNVSDSAPRGLYRVQPGSAPTRGAMVIARVPERFRQFAAVRRYLPANVPLVKQVAAVPGDRICAVGRTILVNVHRVALRRDTDAAGRAMPAWYGCQTLGSGQYLLLMPHPNSFDGRYFGISERHDILGTARLIWAR